MMNADDQKLYDSIMRQYRATPHTQIERRNALLRAALAIRKTSHWEVFFLDLELTKANSEGRRNLWRNYEFKNDYWLQAFKGL